MLIAGATVLLASTELSLAILYASVFLFFSSLGSVQFSLRHVYYLEVFYWLSAAIILRFLFRAALSLSRHRRIGLFQVRLILMPSAVVVGIFVALTGTLSGLQAYQQSGVVDLIERYLAAPRSNIEFDIEQEGASTLYRPRGTFRNFGGIQVAFAGRENNAFYLLLTLDGTACSAPVLPVRVEYAAKGPASEISRDMYMMFGTDRGPSYLFIPVRNAVDSRFQGFRIPTNQRACLAHIQSVSGSANLSLPLWIRLPAEWRSLRFYQAFERPIVRWPFSSTNLVSVTNPPQFATDLGGRKLDIWPLNENRWDTVEPPAQLLGQAIRLTGAPKFGEAYAAISNKLQLIGGSWVAARGLATHGGLVLGILDKDNRWAGYVKAPLGSFQIAVKVPADGEYRIAISYNLPAGPQSTINAEVTEVGLVGLDPSAVRAPDEPKPQFEIMPLEESAWEQQVPPARIAGRVIGLQGHPDNPLGYAMVSSRYQLTKGTLVAVAGRVRQGGITVGLLDGREQWAATKAISPGAFSTGVEVPADGEYRIAISYNLPAGPQSTINAEVTEVGLVGLDPSAVRAPDEPKPQFEIMPLEESAWEQQVPPARIAGRVIGLQGHPDNPLGYAMVSSRYQLTKGTLVAVAGRVRQGGITVGLLDGREQWAATKAISPGAFSTGVEVPADGEYRIAISYNLPAGPQSTINAEVTEVGLVGLDPSAVRVPRERIRDKIWRVICRWVADPDLLR